MAKLYIFGIGGTGSRVLKALSLLLASGVKLDNNIEKIIPIIIDPDVDNGDKTRTSEILRLYHEIRDQIDNPKDFFSANIQTLSQANNSNCPFSHDNFHFKLDGADTQKFRQFIGAGELSGSNAAIKDLLFSPKNLEADMKVGFKGNPNIGSVVLNQLVKSQQYVDFAQSFSPGDKIFIISSIFGGTGAAGFPLLLKNLRSGQQNIPNSGEIQNATIGALTVLPYFNVSNNDLSEIDSDSFMEKAKSAMSYYDRSIIQNKELNSLYYIGDTPKTTYSNVEGSDKQKNDAHFVELAGALSILDFCRNADGLTTINGKADQTYFKEFGVEQNEPHMSFKALDEVSRDIIKPSLSKLMLSSLFLRLGSQNSKKTAWMIDKSTKTDQRFFDSPEYTNRLNKFFEYYEEWLREMARNDVSFTPFNTNVDKNDAMRFIMEYEPTKDGFIKSNNGFKKLDMAMTKYFVSHNTGSPTSQLLKTLEYSTEEVLKKRNLI